MSIECLHLEVTARRVFCVINLWGVLADLAYPQAHPQLLLPQLLVHTLNLGRNLGIDPEPAYIMSGQGYKLISNVGQRERHYLDTIDAMVPH